MSAVSRVIGTGNKLDIWSGVGWGYHQLFLPENELKYKQFFPVIQIDSIDVGDDQTALELKPYFPPQAYRGRTSLVGTGWPNPAKQEISALTKLFHVKKQENNS